MFNNFPQNSTIETKLHMVEAAIAETVKESDPISKALGLKSLDEIDEAVRDLHKSVLFDKEAEDNHHQRDCTGGGEEEQWCG